MVRPRAPLLVTMTLYFLTRSGGESELLVGGSVCAPFNESEQLGSHARLPDLNVETSQPLVLGPSVYRVALSPRPGVHVDPRARELADHVVDRRRIDLPVVVGYAAVGEVVVVGAGELG